MTDNTKLLIAVAALLIFCFVLLYNNAVLERKVSKTEANIGRLFKLSGKILDLNAMMIKQTHTLKARVASNEKLIREIVKVNELLTKEIVKLRRRLRLRGPVRRPMKPKPKAPPIKKKKSKSNCEILVGI